MQKKLIRKKMTNRSLIAVFLLLNLLIGSQLLAHQKKEAITRVIFNERTSSIEIIHRFSLHDAEHASKQLFGISMDILKSAFSQKHFADYVIKNFTLKFLTGEAAELANVGFEIDGRYIWVYQETPLMKDIKGFAIGHSALHDIWPEHVNLINIERNKKVRSLVFKGTSGTQQITFNSE